MIDRALSNRLHFIRWSAAIIVLIGHVQMVSGWRTQIDLWPIFFDLAHTAVMAFFVLSGFIIAHVSLNTDRFSTYLQERATRIYSVLIPATLFTLLFDAFGNYVSPDLYDGYTPKDNFTLRFIINLLGMQGWQGFRVQMGTNSPLWSIGFEVFFYLLYGFIFYKILSSGTTKARWAFIFLAAVLCLFVGTEMLLYWSIWLLGVFAYKASLSNKYPTYLIAVAVTVCVTSIFMVPSGFLQDFLFSLGLALFLLTKPRIVWTLPVNRFLADFSYSLYATHLPVIFLLYAVCWQEGNSPYFFAFIVVATTLVFAYVFSLLFEKNRYLLRNWIKAIFYRLGWIELSKS